MMWEIIRWMLLLLIILPVSIITFYLFFGIVYTGIRDAHVQWSVKKGVGRDLL